MSLIPSDFVCLDRRARLLFALALGFVLIPSRGVAQSAESSSQVNSDANSGGNVAPSADSAAILRELDAMKQRIAELEAELKARGPAPADASAATTATELTAAKDHLLPAPAATSTQPAQTSASSVVPGDHARVDGNALTRLPPSIR